MYIYIYGYIARAPDRGSRPGSPPVRFPLGPGPGPGLTRPGFRPGPGSTRPGSHLAQEQGWA